MDLIDYAYIWIGAVITLLLQLLCYKEFTKRPLRMTFVSSALIFITAILTVINIYFNYSFTKLIINFAIITANCYITFSESKNVVLVKSMIVYLIIVSAEIILSAIILLTNINNIIDFDTNVLMKIAFSSTVMTVSLVICKIKFIKMLSKRFVEKVSARISNILYLILSLLLVMFLTYKFMTSFDTAGYILNLLILICFSILMTVTISSYIRTQKVEQQQETLLEFMSKYEKMIDDGRINRHEMLNNLLILRSFKNKNTKEYSELLDELIEMYGANKDTIKNLYNLPSGLKGILYYKLNEMKSINIDVILNIAKKVELSFKKFSNKDYNYICRVITILLDNARDAASVAKEKLVLIELFLENENLVISIENTFKDKVDFNKLSAMNYSTKGKGRGLGLYIANNIINNTNIMHLDQKIIDEKYFTSILRVKK